MPLPTIRDYTDIFTVGDVEIRSDNSGGYWLTAGGNTFFHVSLLDAFNVARGNTNDPGALIKLQAIIEYFKEREDQIHDSINDPADLMRLTARMLEMGEKSVLQNQNNP